MQNIRLVSRRILERKKQHLSRLEKQEVENVKKLGWFWSKIENLSTILFQAKLTKKMSFTIS